MDIQQRRSHIETKVKTLLNLAVHLIVQTYVYLLRGKSFIQWNLLQSKWTQVCCFSAGKI